MTAPQYTDRDTCTLPDLVDGQQILQWGTQFTCAHGFVWSVDWSQDWGGQMQPRWSRIPPAS